MKNEFDDFYLWCLLHNVYHDDEKLNIQWLSAIKGCESMYTPNYHDVA